ncbi:hypothetical protein C8R45DRAFT_1043715 [Mycena sanguinolenta]|nr:hypothetical protein C8R45DRAFT_1043715 [Mycena sanguinolenta]
MNATVHMKPPVCSSRLQVPRVSELRKRSWSSLGRLCDHRNATRCLSIHNIAGCMTVRSDSLPDGFYFKASLCNLIIPNRAAAALMPSLRNLAPTFPSSSCAFSSVARVSEAFRKATRPKARLRLRLLLLAAMEAPHGFLRAILLRDVSLTFCSRLVCRVRHVLYLSSKRRVCVFVFPRWPSISATYTTTNFDGSSVCFRKRAEPIRAILFSTYYV